MRRAALAGLLVAAGAAVAAAVPSIETPVTDLADVLSPAEEEALAQRLVEHREATGVQIAVLVVGTTAGVPIEDYALDVASRWAGGTRGRDDGALVVLAVSDRRARVELGYGLEGFLSDGQAKALLGQAGPSFAAGRYADGLGGVVGGIVAATASIEPGKPISRPLGSRFPLVYLLVVIPAFLLGHVLHRTTFGPRLVKGRKSRKKAGLAPWFLRVPAPVRHVLVGAVVAVPVAMVLVFREGAGFATAYPLIFLGAVLLGFLWGAATWRKPGLPVGGDTIAGWIMFAIFLLPPAVGGMVAFAMNAEAPPWTGAALLLLGAAHGAIGLAVVGIVAAARHMPASSGGSTYSSGGSSWSSSSSSSSSWSSSSSSSSYSSSSYSGGGGSFGGGGASSSW